MKYWVCSFNFRFKGDYRAYASQLSGSVCCGNEKARLHIDCIQSHIFYVKWMKATLSHTLTQTQPHTHVWKPIQTGTAAQPQKRLNSLEFVDQKWPGTHIIFSKAKIGMIHSYKYKSMHVFFHQSIWWAFWPLITWILNWKKKRKKDAILYCP